MLKSFLRDEVNNPRATPECFAETYFGDVWEHDFTKQMMLVDLLTWLPDLSLVRSNKLAMAVGLEQRVPLLDHRLVELGFAVPTRFKISKRGHGKQILKEALRDYLPDFIVGQPKRGWFSPAAKWLRSGLNTYAKEVLSPSYCEATQEFFDFDAIQLMFDDHVSKKQYNLNALWALMTFQVWHQKHL